LGAICEQGGKNWSAWAWQCCKRVGVKLTERVIALHLRIGLTVTVVVLRARQEHARPEEIAGGLDGAQIAVLHIHTESAEELGGGAVEAAAYIRGGAGVRV